MGKDVTENTRGLEKEVEKNIKKRGNKKLYPSEKYMKELREKDPEKHLKMVKKYFTGMNKGGKVGAAMSVKKLKQITNKRNEAETRRKQAAEMQKMKPKGGDKKGMGPMGGQKPLQKPDNPGLSKLPEKVRNKMGYMKKGGKVGMGMTKNNYKKGGSVKCKRDGICVRGKTKGRMV